MRDLILSLEVDPIDKTLFQERLNVCNWEDYYKSPDPEVAWDHLLSQFIPILDEMCPVRTFKVKNYRPDWVTAELVEQIKDRDYFYKRAKHSGDEDAWNISKHLRNITNANIRQAKRDFVLNELETESADYKRFWSIIKSAVPNDKGNTKKDIMLKDGTSKIDKNEVAHFINSFFINIGKVVEPGPLLSGQVSNNLRLTP